MVIGKMVKEMDTEHFITLMALNMKANGKII